MKDVRVGTDYIQLGDLFKILDGLAEKLRELEPTCELTGEEIHEFLYHEDDRGEIFNTGKEQGRLEIIKMVVECLEGQPQK